MHFMKEIIIIFTSPKHKNRDWSVYYFFPFVYSLLYVESVITILHAKDYNNNNFLIKFIYIKIIV